MGALGRGVYSFCTTYLLLITSAFKQSSLRLSS